jgi:hypothetical protein
MDWRYSVVLIYPAVLLKFVESDANECDTVLVSIPRFFQLTWNHGKSIQGRALFHYYLFLRILPREGDL